MLCFLILLLTFNNCEAGLKLVFSDEFDGFDSIDHDKWVITHNSKKCNEIILFEFLTNCVIFRRFSLSTQLFYERKLTNN